MKISIVTISYNQSEFLDRAIKSVVEQDYDDVEYIVVDAGSTDGSREIIDRYRSKINKVVFKPDRGPPDGLNRGLRLATGKIFGYLNSDDVLLPGALNEVLTIFKSDPSADVVYGHGYIIDAVGRPVRRFYSDTFTPWRFVHFGSNVMQQSTFFRREALLEVGGFNVENTVLWDGELFLDVVLAGKNIRLIPRFWSAFTIHDSSISFHKGNISERARRLAVLRKKTRERLFYRVMDRAPDWRYYLMVILARVQKWVSQPVGTFWRVPEKLGILPKVGPEIKLWLNLDNNGTKKWK